MNTEAKIKNYKIGCVICLTGWNDAQSAWVTKTLTMATKFSEPPIILFVLGFSTNESESLLIPRHVVNKPLPAGVVAELVAMPASASSRHDVEAVMREVNKLDVDEVWCFPVEGQTHTLCKSRPNAVFQAGSHSLTDPQRFKRIPPWVSVDLPAKKPSIFRSLK